MDIRADAIDRIIKNAIQVMEDSKYQIFEISQHARSERDLLEKELQGLMEEITRTIEKVDDLERKYKLARIRLTEVSKDFFRFREEDIKSAYEMATSFQLDVSIHREKENHLKARRDELHRRIKNSEKTIERAETLGSQMNVVLEYLSGDLNQVTRILESAKNRQMLGLKIILAQEEERKRIAREIHDGVAQSLANVVLRAEIAERMIDKREFDVVKEEINDLKGQVRSGLEEIRKIMFNLRPMALDDLGLIPTLRKYTQDFEEKTKIRTRFDMIGTEKRLPSAMEVAIYRLVQEAFSNAAKHSKATFLSLEFAFQKHMVKVSVKDNGVGFLVHENRMKTDGTGYGLIGMKERVDLLEGRLEVHSELNEGTLITLLIPISMDNGKEKINVDD
ncbi:sensor histidine kinase [Ferviditalea candida]|uniref:Signal transduction histidine-protein kinase/phosphatase DegS n=1 Tax=Ferviditalea candida TaxID=3108399 RepID=A0ABU5ZJG9_9BACL|nr:sensor histidine kinase [Paenibacillaceae bacterium T2]